MKCTRCHGTMVSDGDSRCEYMRCISCGDVVDSVILANRNKTPQMLKEERRRERKACTYLKELEKPSKLSIIDMMNFVRFNGHIVSTTTREEESSNELESFFESDNTQQFEQVFVRRIEERLSQSAY